MRILSPAIAVCIALCVQACSFVNCEKGTGEVVRQPLAVAAFNGIHSFGALEVRITKAGALKVEVEGQANLFALLTSEVQDGIWRIGTTGCYSSTKPFIIHIATPGIDHVTIQGSGDVKSADTFTVDAFTAIVQGSGGIDMTVEARSVTAVVQGSGDIDLKGRCVELDARLQGSGDINAGGVIAAFASASIGGSGDITVHATDELNATVQGSGDVRYKGEPAKLNKQVNGSGDVSAIR
ncbi:MAG: DUF2807 domain-containing protein [Flavobacteriales bacterium]|nr:DUF2807 domain-containing protein [Flavobacteriales bacterium]